MQWDGIHTLVQQAKTGNERAWDDLHAMVRPFLSGLALRVLGPDWPHDSVSDLLQSTWVRACRGIGAFRGGENDAETGARFKAWLTRTLKNVRKNEQRFCRAARRKTPAAAQGLGETVKSGSGQDLLVDETTPSCNLRRGERDSLIQQALRRLQDGKDREIVRLRFFEELSLAQIAKRLKLRYDDVRERFHLSLKRLKPDLQGLQ